jgi:5'-3' exonuclease
VGRYVLLKTTQATQLIIVAMGKVITDEEKDKESWDSNAITPGTPFMALLAASLRYWVVEKMNTDPGWKDVRSENFLETLFIHFFLAPSYHL